MLEGVFISTARALSIISSSLLVKLRIKKGKLTSYITLGRQLEGKAMKNEIPTVCFSFMKILQQIGQFWSRIS